jgi:hypothetical protein
MRSISALSIPERKLLGLHFYTPWIGTGFE